MIAVVAFVALVVAVTAPVCGHQGQPFPPARWWRRATGRGAAGPRSRSMAPLAAESLASDSSPATAAERRSARRTPSWAHTQPLDLEEAA